MSKVSVCYEIALAPKTVPQHGRSKQSGWSSFDLTTFFADQTFSPDCYTCTQISSYIYVESVITSLILQASSKYNNTLKNVCVELVKGLNEPSQSLLNTSMS